MLNYTELSLRTSLFSRFEYAKLTGEVGAATFGYDRYLNQKFYAWSEWKRVRDEVIIRDNGCDLGIPGYEIHDQVLVHHMNPITVHDLDPDNFNQDILDPEYLICVTRRTHNAIHFGDSRLLPQPVVERQPGDTKLW